MNIVFIVLDYYTLYIYVCFSCYRDFVATIAPDGSAAKVAIRAS